MGGNFFLIRVVSIGINLSRCDMVIYSFFLVRNRILWELYK